MLRTRGLKKIKQNVPLSHKVEEQLREAIIQKVYSPGERLPSETELVELFGISRTAIREALRMLAGQGLVDIRGRSGAFVADLNTNHIVKPLASLILRKCGDRGLLYVMQARKELEPENARKAALHRTEEDLRYLEACFSNHLKSLDDVERMIDYDIQFHTRLAHASGNPIIPIIMEPIFLLMPKLFSVNFNLLAHRQAPVTYHEQILKCVANQDGDSAYQAMLEHMETAEKHVLESYEEISPATK